MSAGPRGSGAEQLSATVLARFIRSNDLAALTTAIQCGAHVDGRGVDGTTPLMVAAGLGQVQSVASLLAAGSDVLAIEPIMGAAAIHKAAQSGNPDVLALLLDAGAFVDQQSPVLGNTALIDAVLHKHVDAVRLLLERGARTTIRNHWQQSALELARDDGSERIVSLIEERDVADAERVGDLALVAAVKSGSRSDVERLIAVGADIEQRVPIIGSADDAYTPLGLAVREQHVAIVQALLDAGADPRRTIGLMRGTPLHEAAFFGKAELVALLSEPRNPDEPAADLDAQGPYNGLTALHDAVWHGHAAAVKVLVDAGARRDLTTHAGLTAYEMALLYGYDDIAGLLSDRD